MFHTIFALLNELNAISYWVRPMDVVIMETPDHLFSTIEVDTKATTSVQPSTVGKWVQTAMEKAGVDKRYKAHSLRSTTSTKAVMLRASIDQVKDHTSWS
ncbi:hypothetical protein G6F33_001963 [Rhizopus arrhizus]|nr:hypothetical protein G6F33_001963 [Rhizopus arrhizus]